MNDYNAD